MGTDMEERQPVQHRVTEGSPEWLWRTLVVRTVLDWQAMRCAKARAYLLTHDRHYRSEYVGMEIVNRRNKLYGEGVSPADPRIPNRWSVEAELPPMSWPRKDIFDR